MEQSVEIKEDKSQVKGKMWNLWHGCRKYSEGCQNCYVYRTDAKYGRDSSIIAKNKDFDIPIRRKKNGEYTCRSGTFFWTCFTSDFLLDLCDEWRVEAWQMIKERSDCHFLFITKRIHRFTVNLPENWGKGYDNVSVCVTCENQLRADERLPIFKSLPIKHKSIILEPLLESVDIKTYLDTGIKEVVAGGESGLEARVCDYDWILGIRNQCMEADVSFRFKQTGSLFRKDGILYKIPRRLQHLQARKAGIGYMSTSERSIDLASDNS